MILGEHVTALCGSSIIAIQERATPMVPLSAEPWRWQLGFQLRII